MKVALLLYGQPRHLQNQKAFFKHREDILSKYDVDVYAQAWFAPMAQYDISSWAKEHGSLNAHVPFDTANIIMMNYQPLALQLMRPKKFETNIRCEDILEERFAGTKFYSKENISNIYSQLTAIETVAKMVLEQETYDFYILARYDAILDKFPDLNNLSPGFYLPEGGHFNDLIHVFTDQYLEFFVTLTNSIRDPWITSKMTLPIPELYKFEHFKLFYNETDLKKIDMYAHVIRG